TMGHPSFVMSASFTNQTLVQIELFTNDAVAARQQTRWAMKRPQPNSAIDSRWGEQARKVRIGLCEVTNGVVANAATRSEKLFAIHAMPRAWKGEKTPWFGLWCACRDNNPALHCTCGGCRIKLDGRRPCFHVRTTQNKWTKLEVSCEGLR